MASGGRSHSRMSRHRGKSTGPEPYDFRRPTKLSREHVRTLQIAYEAFARRHTTLLTTTLRAVSQVELISIGQQTYDEYIASLSSPTIVALFTIDPLPGTAILEFSLNTAMACIDHMLGGPGGPQPQRPLSEIETPLLKGLIERTLQELRYAFETIVTLNPEMTAIEYNPQFAQAGGVGHDRCQEGERGEGGSVDQGTEQHDQEQPGHRELGDLAPERRAGLSALRCLSGTGRDALQDAEGSGKAEQCDRPEG